MNQMSCCMKCLMFWATDIPITVSWRRRLGEAFGKRTSMPYSPTSTKSESSMQNRQKQKGRSDVKTLGQERNPPRDAGTRARSVARLADNQQLAVDKQM